MDFALTDELQAVTDLAEQVLGPHAAPGHLAGVEAAGGVDQACWRALGETGLLGVALPVEVGGGGQGFVAAHLLLEAAGRHVAHVPVWQQVTSGLALAHLDGDRELLARVASGQVRLALALQEDGAEPWDPTTSTVPDDDRRVRVTGTKVLVAWADGADHLLVSARPRAGGPPGLVLVDCRDATVTPHAATSGVPHAMIELDGAAGTPLAPDDATALPWVLDRAVVGLTALQAGMLDAAVQLAAEHTSQREQFGRPVATFQAVSQRVASAFVDAECARLCALEAAWRLHEELPAREEVVIAKWWAAEAGHRVLHAAQHVHGGIGVDREYPLHRYYLRTKQVEFTLGSGVDQLGRLGRSLAAEPA